MEGFVGGEEDLVLYTGGDGKPMEVLEDWGDVVSGAGVSEEACS